MIIGTAGHIDHGKTALVRALTGVDTDRLPEEKRRGITIDLGFAPIELPGAGTASVVDVPGHEAFVRTMLAGATGIDVALLVVAADEGIMPQSREHIAILDLLGVRRCVVAMTKADLVEPAWLEMVAQDIERALQRTTLAGAVCVAVSSTTGQGVETLRAALADAAAGLIMRDANDAVRLPVDRVFTKAGTGTVVTGTLWSGALRVGDEITLLPSSTPARIRGLQTHGASVERALSGSRVAVALAGVDHDAVARGDVVVSGDAWTPTAVIRADVTLLSGAPPLTARSRVRLHLGTQDIGARVVCAGGPLNAGERRAARVILERPLVARGGDRFVLRRTSPNGTIGGGIVVDAAPGRRRAKPFASIDIPVADRIAVIVDEAALGGVPAVTIPIRMGLTPEASRSHVSTHSNLIQIGPVIVARSAIDAANRAVIRALDDYHRAHPKDAGASLEHVRSMVHAAPTIVEHVIGTLVEQAIVVIDGATIRRQTWRPAGDPAGDTRKQAILARLTAAGPAAPPVRELENEFGSPVIPALRQLEREGLAIALSTDRFASAAAAADLRKHILASLTPGQAYLPTELKAVFGVSRQYLMAWLEYFDRAGFSRREGDGRRFW